MSERELRGRIAQQILEQCETVYPPDIFLPVTPEDVVAYHAAFRAAGLSVDQWTAHIMRFGYSSIAMFVRGGGDD